MPTKLEEEAAQIKKELDQLRATLDDPNADPDDKQLARNRITRVTDDYRLILNSVAQAQGGGGLGGMNVEGRGVWSKDAQGNWVNVVEPAPKVTNPDEDVATYIKRENAERDRLERQRNDAAGVGYVTAKERSDIENTARARNYDDARLRQEISNQASINRREDAKLDIEQAKLPGELAKTGAEARRIGVAADLDAAQIAALGIKTESDATRAEAAGVLDKAQADQIRQKLRQPQVVSLGEGPTYATMGPEGQITEQYRQGYVPKTRAEVAARVGQMQSLAEAKKQEVMAKYRDNPEQGLSEFNSWYDRNIQSQLPALQAAQEEATRTQAKDEAEQRRQAYVAAQGAGQNAAANYIAMVPTRVGPGFGNILGQAGTGDLSKADWSTAFAPARDPNDIARQQTMEALKYLSPTAAQAVGAPPPNYGAVDPFAALNRTNYQIGGGQPPAAPAPGNGLLPPGAAGVPGQDPRLAGPPSNIINRGQLPQTSYQIPGLNPGMMPGGQGLADFQAQQAAAAAAPPPAPPPPAAAAYVPQARPVAPPAPAPAGWGPSATAAMNVGGWGTPEPWGPAASNAMNVGGWNTSADYVPPPNLVPAYPPSPAPSPPDLVPQYPPSTAVPGVMDWLQRFNRPPGQWFSPYQYGQ